MSALIEKRGKSSPTHYPTVSPSVSTITQVWNSRLRSASRDVTRSVDVLTPKPKRTSLLHPTTTSIATAVVNTAAATSAGGSGCDDVWDSDEGLTDTPAARAPPSASHHRHPLQHLSGSAVDSGQRLGSIMSSVSSSASTLRSHSRLSSLARPSLHQDPNMAAQLDLRRSLAKPLFCNSLLSEAADPHHRLTVVLDLDETLVNNRNVCRPEATLRPYCLHMLNSLRHMSELELVLWTASTKETASPVVEQLHAKGIIFDDIIFRNDAWFTHPVHTKDLRLLGRDLDRVLIIDNSVGCCKMHPRNTLLVKDFDGTRRREDASLVNVYYIVQALLRMRMDSGMTVAEGIRAIASERRLCHSVNFELPNFFKNIPLSEVPELKRPPVGRFLRANSTPPETSIMEHWWY